MRRAKDGAALDSLLALAVPWLKQAEQLCPRTGPGRRPTITDWQMAGLIMLAVFKRRKSKSAQYRYLQAHGERWQDALRLQRLPARSTYFDRYRRAHRILQRALYLHSLQAQREVRCAPQIVAVDKSVILTRGPAWTKHQRRRGERRAGVDCEAGWTYSAHHGWQYGYGYEVVVTAGKDGLIWPWFASVEPANQAECRLFAAKIPLLPAQTRYVLADKGYDSNALGEAIEHDQQGRRTGRRFLCPQIYRRGEHRRPRPDYPVPRGRRAQRARREQRRRFLETPQGRRLFARRGATVEPFHQWFKSAFELEARCWHRGLDNNRTQLLSALFAYQLLLRTNCRCGQHNNQIAWLLDGL
jgi:hypothetical protein